MVGGLHRPPRGRASGRLRPRQAPLLLKNHSNPSEWRGQRDFYIFFRFLETLLHLHPFIVTVARSNQSITAIRHSSFSFNSLSLLSSVFTGGSSTCAVHKFLTLRNPYLKLTLPRQDPTGSRPPKTLPDILP